MLQYVTAPVGKINILSRFILNPDTFSKVWKMLNVSVRLSLLKSRDRTVSSANCPILWDFPLTSIPLFWHLISYH